MLTTLHLGNFKAFAETQYIPIRPLTLIFGANSAGKSSILHALLLANEATRTENLDIHYTQVGGESVDLGGFRQYIHKADATKRLTLSFELSPSQELSFFPAHTHLRATIIVGMEHEEEMEERSSTDSRTGKHITVKVPTGRLTPVGAPRVQSFTLAANGEDLIQVNALKGGQYKLRLMTNQPLIEEMLRSLVLVSTTATEVTNEDLKLMEEFLIDYLDKLNVVFKGILPRWLKIPTKEPAVSSGEIIPVGRGTRGQDITAAISMFLPGRLRAILLTPAREIESWLSSLVYLGPLRSYPQRHVVFSREFDSNWQAGGGFAWDVVRKDENVRSLVNQWLSSDYLSTRYMLVVRDLIPDKLLAEELDALFDDYLERQLEPMDERETRPATEEEVRQFFEGPSRGEKFLRKLAQASPDQLRDLVLIDVRTDTPVSHRDVGIGISQVLPVLVHCYANEGKLVAIEQPEIHLHPALQAELGDVFIESALGERKNTFLLETHSEHLILRIMRRIRETTAGTLPEGIPPIKPDDVSVLYVEPDGSRSIVREMELNANGDFAKSWPGGFFEEGLRELFA